MADKAIVIKIEGDEAIIDAGLDSFARAYGYVDGQEVSKEDVARDAIKFFIRNAISNYNANKAAEEAAKQAAAQSSAALDSAVLSLSVE